MIYGKSNKWTYTATDPADVIVRELTIDSGTDSEPAVLVQLTDMHFNMFFDSDLTDPVLESTAQYRTWNKNGASVPNAERTLEYAKQSGADRTIVTGDVLDILSEGALSCLESLWDKYPKTIISMGNHDTARVVQGKVPEYMPLAPRIERLRAAWRHDITYLSEIVRDKVMIIVMDNASHMDTYNIPFFDSQVEPLKRDLQKARELGIPALLFFHIPLSTNDPEQAYVEAYPNSDGKIEDEDYYHGKYVIYGDEGATGEIRRIIHSSADVIAGCFCGHMHDDYYTEIHAAYPDGTPAVIPQYILRGCPYDKGHALKIIIK